MSIIFSVIFTFGIQKVYFQQFGTFHFSLYVLIILFLCSEYRPRLIKRLEGIKVFYTHDILSYFFMVKGCWLGNNLGPMEAFGLTVCVNTGKECCCWLVAFSMH